jgi:predicted HTH domain antitoxin
MRLVPVFRPRCRRHGAPIEESLEGPIAMNLLIPDEILQASRLSERELRMEIAVMLFEKEKLTLGQASRLADMRYLEFQHLLASRRIPVHYDVADFEQDLRTLNELGRL